jgi:MtrB/PioB family decaheme-associated outer membrane protein
MTRQGSQVAGITALDPPAGSPFNSPTQVAAPVDDTTQNFGASGEYAGTWLSGQKYSIKVAYTGSKYTDNLNGYDVQNPYFPTLGSCTPPKFTGTVAVGTQGCLAARISTPPSNSANGLSGTVAADLPFFSRYVGTVNYTKMTQDDIFIPMTANPFAVASPFNGGANWGTLGALPRTSLDGAIDTLLVNNVVTTKLTPELTSKLTYRYYDFDNQTPRFVLPCWISNDGTGAPIVKGGNPCGGSSLTGTGFENTISSLQIGYTKQNAGANLNWRPSREWNFNAEYGYERYNWTQADVTGTNENFGKTSFDWKPTGWFTFRASGSYGVRNPEVYDYNDLVRAIQFPAVFPFLPQASTSFFYAPAYQQFMFDHRDRTTANVAIDLVAFRGITITPTFKYKDDHYGLNPLNQEGVDDSREMSWGIDAGYVPSPNLTFAVSYYWEFYTQTLYNYTNATSATNIAGPPLGFPWEAQPGICAPSGLLANCLITTGDRERIRTFTALMNWAAIPDTLNLTVRYTASVGLDQQSMVTGAPPTLALCTNCLANTFPDVTTWFQRIDATATYKFDRYWLYQMGWTGDLKAKLRYTWERNSVNNWQNDLLAPFTPAVGTNALWMGYDNPNYNIQMIAGSLTASW